MSPPPYAHTHGGADATITACGITTARENGCATAHAIVQELRAQVFARDTRFHPLETAQPRHWTWTIQLTAE